MSERYVVKPMDEAARLGWPDAWSDEHHYGWGLWLVEDGKPVRLLGDDTGEPEDQCLVRNWSWVAVELERAYREGVEAGKAL